MKPTSVLWLAASLSGLFAPLAQAQSVPRKSALPVPLGKTPQSDKTSWVFLLESRTQWLLVVQENDTSRTQSESPTDLSNPQTSNASTLTGVAGVIGQKPASTTLGSKAHSTSTEDGTAQKPSTTKKPDDTDTTTLIFEGNTLDTPLEPNPEQPPSTPVTPSAPAS